MKASIKLGDGETFHVTVPDNSTVEDLKIAALVALPPTKTLNSRTTKLWYSGKKLEFTNPLASYGISADSHSTVYMTSGDEPMPHFDDSECAIVETDEAPKPHHHSKKSRSKSRSKNRCSYGSCHSPALRLTGECQFCKGHFCSKHRLLEKHHCKGLKTCKDKCFERNALKLRNERTVTSKV